MCPTITVCDKLESMIDNGHRRLMSEVSHYELLLTSYNLVCLQRTADLFDLTSCIIS